MFGTIYASKVYARDLMQEAQILISTFVSIQKITLSSYTIQLVATNKDPIFHFFTFKVLEFGIKLFDQNITPSVSDRATLGHG